MNDDPTLPREVHSGKPGAEAGAGPDRSADEEVLRSVLEGHPRAFDRFVTHFGNRIFGFGVRVCGHREDAEDVFQETLSTVFQKIRTLREPKALSGWLYRVVANACLLRRRRSRFAPTEELSLEELLPKGGVPSAGPALPDPDDPEHALYRKELAEHLDEAVRDLPPDYRIVWVMRDVEGLSTAETAEALEISVPNVKMRLHRARMMLRDRLAHLGPDGARS